MNLIFGNKFVDHRGILLYNNDFDLSEIKRMYLIENDHQSPKRGWQGHAIEKRWYFCATGKFKIWVIKVDNWENPSKDLIKTEHILDSDNGLNLLYIDPGHITLIESLILDSKLVVFSNYKLGEINDEYRYSIEYF